MGVERGRVGRSRRQHVRATSTRQETAGAFDANTNVQHMWLGFEPSSGNLGDVTWGGGLLTVESFRNILHSVNKAVLRQPSLFQALFGSRSGSVKDLYSLGHAKPAEQTDVVRQTDRQTYQTDSPNIRYCGKSQCQAAKPVEKEENICSYTNGHTRIYQEPMAARAVSFHMANPSATYGKPVAHYFANGRSISGAEGRPFRIYERHMPQHSTIQMATREIDTTLHNLRCPFKCGLSTSKLYDGKYITQ